MDIRPIYIILSIFSLELQPQGAQSRRVQIVFHHEETFEVKEPGQRSSGREKRAVQWVFVDNNGEQMRIDSDLDAPAHINTESDLRSGLGYEARGSRDADDPGAAWQTPSEVGARPSGGGGAGWLFHGNYKGADMMSGISGDTGAGSQGPQVAPRISYLERRRKLVEQWLLGYTSPYRHRRVDRSRRPAVKSSVSTIGNSDRSPKPEPPPILIIKPEQVIAQTKNNLPNFQSGDRLRDVSGMQNSKSGGTIVKRSVLPRDQPVLLHRSPRWSADDLVANEISDKTTQRAGDARSKNLPVPNHKYGADEVQVIRPDEQGKEKNDDPLPGFSGLGKWRIFAWPALAIIGGIFGVVFCYKCWYKGGCCNCEKSKQEMAQKYLPGMEIDESGKAVYRKITEEEKEALRSVAGIL